MHARTGEDDFRTIANSLPALISFLDKEQRYQFCNNRYGKMLGSPPGGFVGLTLPEVLGKDLYPTLKPLVERTLRGHISSFEGYINHEMFGKAYVHADYVPHRDEHGIVDGFYSVTRDLTALKDAEEKFRIFVQNAPVPIIIHHPNGAVAVANTEAERLFGYSSGEMVGQPVEILVPERFRRKHAEDRKMYMKKPRLRPMGNGLELTAMRKDGHEFPAEITLSPMETTAGTFVSATVFDLTERKRLEEQTRLAAILQDRARVAMDLHDTLAQGFTGIIMHLEAAEETAANLPKETRTLLEKAERVARENLQEVRRFLVELSAPPERRVTDLVGSLRKLAARAHNGKTRANFSLHGTPFPLGGVLKENLLFIARQATDNALQHAHATKIHIGIAFNKEEIQIQVQDDGRGFDVKKAARGFGLITMRDRAKYVGGRFRLNSRRGKGTRIAVTVPLSAAQPSVTPQ